MINPEHVRAFRQAGLTVPEIAERLGCSEVRIHQIIAQEKAKGWNPKEFRDKVLQDEAAAKAEIVGALLDADTVASATIRDKIKAGEIELGNRDWHQLRRGYIGNKQVQENVLKLDPATLSRLEQIMAATDHRLPRALPPSTITAEIIDDSTSPR